MADKPTRYVWAVTVPNPKSKNGEIVSMTGTGTNISSVIAKAKKSAKEKFKVDNVEVLSVQKQALVEF